MPPQCGWDFEVSRLAIFARCPACTSSLAFTDLMLRYKVQGDFCAVGHISLHPPSEMVGRVVCGRFTKEGRFDGLAVVYGTIELLDQSLTTGELIGKSLRVD